jgi:ankyrin repeat protein
MHVAAGTGRIDAMRLLIQKGVSPDQPSENHGYTPLMVAVEMGEMDAAKFLIGAGADPIRKASVRWWCHCDHLSDD